MSLPDLMVVAGDAAAIRNPPGFPYALALVPGDGPLPDMGCAGLFLIDADCGVLTLNDPALENYLANRIPVTLHAEKLKKHPRSWRGTCPACSYAGTFTLKAGRDDRPMLYCANGCTPQQLDDELARRLGDGWKPEPKPEADAQQDAATRAAKSAKAVAIFNGSTCLTATDPAARYLASRYLGHLSGSPVLRYRGDCFHPEGGRYPALVAQVQDAAGQPVACHRTYLRPDGGKAAAEPQKASKGPVWGGAIRIYRAGPEIVVGEGLESSASAGRLLHLPAWAAISAGNLARGLVLPPEVQSVVIAADRDSVGEAAAHEAAARWRAEGRRARIAWPDAAGQDFADVLANRMEAQRHAA